MNWQLFVIVRLESLLATASRITIFLSFFLSTPKPRFSATKQLNLAIDIPLCFFVCTIFIFWFQICPGVSIFCICVEQHATGVLRRSRRLSTQRPLRWRRGFGRQNQESTRRNPRFDNYFVVWETDIACATISSALSVRTYALMTYLKEQQNYYKLGKTKKRN